MVYYIQNLQDVKGRFLILGDLDFSLDFSGENALKGHSFNNGINHLCC